jgi:hypothetical protein
MQEYGGFMNKTNLLMDNGELIIKLYESGKTIKSLGKDFQVSEAWMRKFLLSNNIKTRSRSEVKQRIFDTNFFFEETDELAYFMGFCLADGSISPVQSHRSTLEVCLHAQDISILNKFCDWTKYDKLFISKRKNREINRLCFNHKIFKQDFSKWGLVNNKTYYPVIPNVKDEFIKPFILGYIDGDGSIKISRNSHFNIVGNKILIDWFCGKIHSLGFEHQFKFEDPSEKVWKRARLYQKQQIIDLSKILEIDKYRQLILPRKWSQFI